MKILFFFKEIGMFTRILRFESLQIEVLPIRLVKLAIIHLG